MFVSVQDQGNYRRRSRAYGVKKAARSSKISILSAFTATSSGSSGSTSTVTQESYSRGSEHAKRKKATRRRRTKESSQEDMDVEPRAEGDRKGVDVFSFLVKEDGEEDKSRLASTKAHSTTHNAMSVLLEDSDHEEMTTSIHSDSGISMGESMSDLSLAAFYGKTRLPSLREDECEQSLSPSQAWMTDYSYQSAQPGWLQPCCQPFYDVPVVNDNMFDSNVSRDDTLVDDDPQDHADYEDGVTSPSPCPPDVSGYDLVASELAQSHSELGCLPLFRQFKKVNYRVLLHLQDEISEMEQELSRLDAVDSSQRHRIDGSTAPASRRMSWQWGGSDIQPRRLEILGRLYIKLEQYCMS